VVSSDSEKSVEIQANQWTLTIEGDTPDVAFLAVDDEPTSDREMRNVIDDIVGHGDLNALKLIDQRLEGRLSLALHISGDPLSQHLASVLASKHSSGPH
jgi:predicted PilT family ATPase